MIEEELKKYADQIEKLAFAMPAPNDFTPQFVALANWMRWAARRTVSGQEANPVCWITREQLTRVEDEGEDAWVYWAETGHVAEPDEVALYAAPIPATEQKDAE